ncbi:DNA mismatch repair protein MutS [Starkeya sp. 3C]|uniref:DNA mismatch repair protein MutS n=1 Tax=Ancylobacter moscoviensis TaxID=2597768 RepID=A0ABY3DXI2_9HYPH|nr:DNA mismatch repair protein MutS [Ancylobacter moscoviensis]TSJ64886.1 DNA mismatch repair protein MutS [Ancylobacter moscoviensis]
MDASVNKTEPGEATIARAAAKAAGDAERVTPMMAQYIEIKTANPGSLLFYRMGDFYELFFDDAEAASRTLGIVLTKRGKHQGEDIPMCGVPVERAEEYLNKLIAAGHRVAVCEQVEDPAEAKKRGPKSVVKRDVIRLVTPGTLTEDALLDARRENVLASLARVRGGEGEDGYVYALAFADISTGSFRVAETDAARLAADLARIEPAELLVADAIYDEPAFRPLWRALPAVTPLPKESFDGSTAERRIAGFFQVATLDSFGTFSRAELTAAAGVVAYIERTQLGARPPLSRPQRESSADAMVIDPATRANLEILRTTTGDRAGSLCASVDRTVTSAGARLLARRLAEPLTDAARIAGRLDAVEHLVDETALRAQLRERLAGAPDLARALSRVALGRSGPRDLAAIGRGLTEGAAIAALIAASPAPEELAQAAEVLGGVDPTLAATLAAALDDELPLNRRDGGFTRPGYSDELDATRAMRDESRRVVAALERRYVEETGVRALKIRHNAVLGYYVEVSQQNADRLREPPFDVVFVHRQTMAGAMRFTSTELAELEAKIASAGERALALEQRIFDELAAAVLTHSEAIRACAEALAVIDVTAGLAKLAVDEAHVRPDVHDGLDFLIEGGRHPVVEQALRRDGGPFVANDCELSPPENAKSGRIWLVTGPNMAGKSTFLRQNALIAILAQAGAFVPARAARIGVVDRLFSRVGAADDLARGRSTFMVEMVETAAILNQATERSLVILDEIGRGTATFDGLSIAWASLEHLHEVNRCRGLFATHFHELTALSQRLGRLVNATVKVKEWEGEVIFLHEVVPGAADRSYGIQVAKLAGLPPAVVERARAVLTELESADRAAPAQRILDDLPLFAALNRAPPPEPAAKADPAAEAVKSALNGLDPDEMTPREALDALYRLKAAARGG